MELFTTPNITDKRKLRKITFLWKRFIKTKYKSFGDSWNYVWHIYYHFKNINKKYESLLIDTIGSYLWFDRVKLISYNNARKKFWPDNNNFLKVWKC